MAARKLGRLCEKSTSIFLCDMQEKFRPNIGESYVVCYSFESKMSPLQYVSVIFFV